MVVYNWQKKNSENSGQDVDGRQFFGPCLSGKFSKEIEILKTYSRFPGWDVLNGNSCSICMFRILRNSSMPLAFTVLQNCSFLGYIKKQRVLPRQQFPNKISEFSYQIVSNHQRVFCRNNNISFCINWKLGKRKSDLQMGFEPTTLRDLVGYSNHGATEDSIVSKV